LFFDIILAVIAVVAAPFTGGSSIGLFVAGFLTNMTYTLVATGSAGFTSIQENLVGGNCGGSNSGTCTSAPPVTMSTSYTAAQEFDGYQEGYSNADTSPTAQSSQWDYRPAAAGAIEQAPQNVNGGFGKGYQQTTITPAQAQKGETLSDLANQAQKTGTGYINFGSDTGGITAAAP
jgi:hypothetical protein